MYFYFLLLIVQKKDENPLTKIVDSISNAVSLLKKKAVKGNVFESSMEHESQAIDLVISSKLDSFIQVICSQISHPDPHFDFYPPSNQVYAECGIKEYCEILEQYYKAERKTSSSNNVQAPALDFKVVSPYE